MGSIVGSVLGTVGGILGGGSAANAAETAASNLTAAGQQARQDALFRPVGITSNFGKSTFGFDETGKLNAASYTLDPRLQAAQNQLWGQLASYDPTQIAQAAQPLYGAGSSLFNLGQQYLAQSPEDVAQKWMTQQQGLLAPGREQDLSGLRNKLFQTGRIGLATGGTEAGGMQATNPEMAAYYNSIANQDRQLAAQAQQQGQAQQQFGAGLFSTGASLLGQVPNLTTAGYSPLSTQLNLLNTTESMGQQPLNLGASLGSSAANAGAQAGAANLRAVQAATPYQYQSDSYNPWATGLQGIGSALGSNAGSQLGSWFSNMIGGTNRGVDINTMPTSNWASGAF